MDIQYNAKPDEAITKLTNAQHEQYEEEYDMVYGYTPFQLIAREDGQIAGVLSGYTVYREIYVGDLVTFKGYRGRGVGTRLLAEAEKLFPEKEIDFIHLVTNGFQAPGFYKKCGYTLEFIRKSPTDPKYDKYYFSKLLKRG